MKSTKLFLYSTVAAAALVACNDDLDFSEKAQLQKQDLSNRPVVEDVALEIAGNEVQTRMGLAANGYYAAFEATDSVGAMLVDVATYKNEHDYLSILDLCEGDKMKAWWGLYYIPTDREGGQIWTNYPFFIAEKDGQMKLTTPAKLVEGNYLFYAPYNEDKLTRENYMTKAPVVQNAKGATYTGTYKSENTTIATQATEDFFKSGELVQLGYQKITKENGGKTVKTVLNDIYSYPMFTVVNNFKGTLFTEKDKKGTVLKDGATMTIDKVQIFKIQEESQQSYSMPSCEDEKGHIYVPEGVAPMTAWARLQADRARKVLERENEEDLFSYDWYTRRRISAPTSEVVKNANAWAHPDMKSYSEASPYFTKDEDGNTVVDFDKIRGASNVGGYQASLNLEAVTVNIGETVDFGKSYSFMAVMPAEDYGMNLVAKVYATIDGVQYVFHVPSNVNEKFVSEKKDEAGNVIPESGFGSTAYAEAQELYTKVLKDPAHDPDEAGVVLLRGNRFPAAELVTSGGTKAWAGQMLTIAFDSCAGYQVDTDPEIINPDHYGIKSNEELIEYVKNASDRFQLLVENPALCKVKPYEDATKKSDPYKIWKTEFALCCGEREKAAVHNNHKVVMDADLVKALYDELFNAMDNEQKGYLAFTSTVLEAGDGVTYEIGDAWGNDDNEDPVYVNEVLIENLYKVTYTATIDGKEYVNTVVMPIQTLTKDDTTIKKPGYFVVDGSVSISVDEEVEGKIFIQVPAGNSLTVNKNASLISGIVNEGTLDVTETIDNAEAVITNFGKMSVISGTSEDIMVNVKVVNEKGATLDVKKAVLKNVDNTNNGVVTLKAGAAARFGENNGTIEIEDETATLVVFAGEGTVHNNKFANVTVNADQVVGAFINGEGIKDIPESAAITEIVVNGTATIEQFNAAPATVKKIILISDLIITVTKAADIKLPIEVGYAGGATPVLSIQGTDKFDNIEVTVPSITIAKGASLKLSYITIKGEVIDLND